MARPTNYPQPPAKNTTRVPPAGRGITSQYRPGDAPSRPDVVTLERSVLGAGDGHRAEYAAESAKGQAAMRQRIAELNGDEGASGQAGRDVSNAHGAHDGDGDFLSQD